VKQIKFGKIPQAMPLPDLLEMQTNSFRDFMQLGVELDMRKLLGLQAAFLDVFPIESDDGKPIWTIFSIFSDKLYFEVVECRPGATSVIRHSQIFDNMIDAQWAVEQDAL
jgi:DNA-directed RNA polymerase beta subunit